VSRPFGRALVAIGPNEPRHLRFHQRLREHSNAFAKDIPILLLEELANERRQIHSGFGHRRNTSVSSFSARENSRKDVRWPLPLSSRGQADRISTTSRDSNHVGSDSERQRDFVGTTST
jgi:hypothetical protein